MQAQELVNGPKGQGGWNGINWRQANRRVSNLRQRIFAASQQGDLNKVRNLQKLMLRSYSNVVVSVRRVTQHNKGKDTPGVDKLVVKTPAARWKLVRRLFRVQPWRAKPVRRVYIPKTGGKFRPLGIPVIADRALQAMVKNALEPEWEARFEAISYGFRPCRCCHDAIARLFNAAHSGRKVWALDADIRGAFDHICHRYLLKQLGLFPGRELVKQWLKAGVMDKGQWQATETGVPQGGVVSPLLLNIALHGMEKAIGIEYNFRGAIHPKCSRVLIRYADDFIVLTLTQEDAIKVKDQLAQWLAQRGLSLSEEKTRIVHLTEGFDFLGFNVRLYPISPVRGRHFKLLIKPSKESVHKVKRKLKSIWRAMRGHNQQAVMAMLNPVIRGWANYFRIGVAKHTFGQLDNWMFGRIRRWVRRSHPRKNWKWLIKRYFGQLHPGRSDRWVFGDPKTGRFLLKFVWTPIQRHVLVKGRASPDDPSLRRYWAARHTKETSALPPSLRKLAAKQNGLCPVCSAPLLNQEVLHQHHLRPRKDGGQDQPTNLQLIHLYCHQQLHAKMAAKEREATRCASEPRKVSKRKQSLQSSALVQG